ncbi:hypothetical protein TDB9533_03680 [Thalassocella blandensis]|nr:hypothetical protein TDB9533_03680 [Thalassocella blandensis]
MRTFKHSGFFTVILSLFLFAGNTYSQSSAFLGGECVAINGMYVSLGYDDTGILGNTQKETDLLEFAKHHGFNYLIFYNLEGMSANATRQAQLASLIAKGKQFYGIDEVGAALGSIDGANEISAYNSAHSEMEKVDVLNLEYEFWNSPTREQAFATTLSLLNHFRGIANQQNLETEIYIGWITEDEGLSLANAVDRVLVHFYRQHDTDIIQYGVERLEFLAAGNSAIKIAPIFSNEGPSNTGDPTSYFMGPWLENHSMDQPFKTWFSGYQQLSGSWKQNLNIMGGTWFLYNYFSVIPGIDQSVIASQPQSASACVGESRELSFAITSSYNDIGWFKNGQCIQSSASLAIEDITQQDFAEYQAKVIAYDSGSPAANVTDSAILSPASHCQGQLQNLALNKPVLASSYVAAGYEPFRIVDGDESGSRWASEYSGDQWAQVDLGGIYSIRKIQMFWDAAYAIDYQILTSTDGSSWQIVNNVEDNSETFNEFSYASHIARYVRVSGTEKALPQWGYSLVEMNVLGDVGSGSSCISP